MERRKRRTRAAIIALATIGSVVGIGCATSNGDSDGGATTSGPPTSRSSTPPPPPTPTDPPVFDATFDDDAGQPTPDAGDQCIDNDDPGSSESTAKAIPNIDDCDSSGATLKGVMKGEVDVDFYKFTGSDTTGCTVDPAITSPTTGLEICMFVACQNAPTNFKGCSGGVQKNSDIGDPGCCVATPATTQLSFSCGGTFNFDDSANVFIRVKQISDVCLPYQLAYHF